MGLTNAGVAYLAKTLINDSSPTFFNNANAYIGVGTSNTAFAAAQTDMQANGVRQAMDATYPTISGAILTFRATFATGSANQAWAEWGIFNASSSGTMFQRKVESLGTKTSAQSWQITLTITLNNP